MQELLIAVARGLVEDKDAVQVTVDPAREDGTVVYHLTVAEGDMGRVIGKQGRIAKAIRVVMRAAAVTRTKKSWWKSADFCHPALCRFARRVLFICRRFCAIYSRRFPLCKTICPPAKLFPPTVSAAK